ncbi:hypothetical protein Tco_0952821 [Tanacetum coccineum]|uniref:Reverse transcriptase domain-containing protein n=1 Tax=Tanacetum coccineum TaxID=301880 RepID=A0ABQ5DY33_9ASTR
MLNLVNGSPTEKFCLERGVRKGNSLSSFLFILAAEGLNAIIREAVDKGVFKEVSGLRVNYNKSKLYGVRVNDVDLRDMVR